MATLHVLRVFTAADGSHGNPLGVFLDGRQVRDPRRQPVAADLGFSETVFVDDAREGRIRIYTPGLELPFAGHPCVGSAWLLRRELRASVPTLRPPAGELRVRFDDDLTWVGADAEWAPPFDYVELESPAEVEALEVAPGESGYAYCWAWDDERAGTVRARSFVAEAGISEDEATGSAALALSARLGRAIEVHQGAGSELFARPLEDGWAEVGGRVAFDEMRDYTVDSR